MPESNPTLDEIRTAEIRAARILVKREAKWRMMVMFLAVLVLFSAVVTIVSYRQTRVARAELLGISRANQQVLVGVDSCTKPEGECFQAGVRTRLLLENEAIQVKQHRDRNEELHFAICEREDEIAKQLGLTLKTKCPPLVQIDGGTGFEEAPHGH